MMLGVSITLLQNKDISIDILCPKCKTTVNQLVRTGFLSQDPYGRIEPEVWARLRRNSLTCFEKEHQCVTN